MTDTRVVLTTTDSAEEAERLARAAVDARLAACVQIVARCAARSGGRGAVSVETEWQLLAKTAAARVDDLTALLVGTHTYDVPEVIVLPVVGGHGPYLAWVTQETEERQDG